MIRAEYLINGYENVKLSTLKKESSLSGKNKTIAEMANTKTPIDCKKSIHDLSLWILVNLESGVFEFVSR